jgi:flagellar biosynthesis protein FlhB
MMEDVPTADVVITNPTHVSVALSYADSVERAPGRRQGPRPAGAEDP